MKITGQNFITFKAIELQERHGLIIPKKVDCHDKQKNSYTLKTDEKVYPDKIRYKTLVLNANGYEIANDSYFFSDGNIYTQYMKNNSRTKMGIGNIMHLQKVIELIENNKNALILKSLPEALFFHAKFGFKSNIKTQEERENTLGFIIRNAYSNTVFWDLSQEAVNLLYPKDKSYYNFPLQNDIARCNELFDRFIRIAINNNATDNVNLSACPDTFPMQLTRTDIIKNKEFYNKLFQKYGIDYKI